MKRPTFSQGKAYLKSCIINGIPNSVILGGQLSINYAVHRVQIVEHICKPYFTGTVVIENFLNGNELFLNPMATVVITFVAPRDDGASSIEYTESFSILNHETKVIDIEAQGRTETTIDLIGIESKKNDSVRITQNFANVTGTTVARILHSTIASNGGLRIPVQSKGMIGLTDVPHEIKEMHPISAIRNVLLRSVFAQYKSGAPVYYRDKKGYVIAPLQHLLENGNLTNSFIEKPNEGSDFLGNFLGYENIIELKQFFPPNRHSTRAASRAQSFDIKGGQQFLAGKSSQKLLAGFTKAKNTISGLNSIMPSILGTAPGKMLFNMLNEHHQKLEVTKDGPGQYNVAQDAFLYVLGLSPRYRVLVPMQGGLKVTCGNRISITFPILTTPTTRKLFVYEVVHNLVMIKLPVTGPGHKKDRLFESYSGKTELNCVYWET